jgi:Na+/proline symporter
MLASFAAAYMSTQATQMNWGSSYLMNDLYRRFINKDASERHYVTASRVATAFTLVLSLVVTVFMDQVSHAWQFLIMLGAGTGLVYILRWYWWRVNAWSEVSAMAAALVVSLTMHFTTETTSPAGFARTLLITTIATTVVWLIVTFATKPEPQEKLRSFYLKVRPAGPGWAPLVAATGVQPPKGEISRNALSWVLGIALVYGIMFGTGALLFDQPEKLAICSAIVLVTAVGLVIMIRRDDPVPSVASPES